MSTLEQQAVVRKAKLAQLRAKRATPSTTSDSQDKGESKKPKLVQRNFVSTDEEEGAITKLVIENEETVETVAKSIEKDILDKYHELSKVDWSEIGNDKDKKGDGNSINKHKVDDEYKEKLKLQELELMKLTNESISRLKKELAIKKT